MEIIKRNITEEEIDVYINLLMSKIDNWYDPIYYDNHSYTGPMPRIFSDKERYYEEEATLIIDELKSFYLHNRVLLKSKLNQLGLIPSEIFIISDDKKLLPIYTGVYQAGRCSVILEAFFDNEKHLLDNQGNILLVESVHEIRIGELDGKEIVRLTYDDGICQFSTFLFYDYQSLGDCRIDFQSEVNIDYLLCGGSYEKKFKGNGKNMVFENLPLGKYYIENNGKKLFEKSIGQFLEDAGEFTINSFCFPDFSQKYKYEILLNEIDKADSPKETVLRIISDIEQKESHDVFYDFSIYPYLPKYLREDLDIILTFFLLSLKRESHEFTEVPKTLQELSQAIKQNEKFICENKYKIIIDIPSVDEATEALSESIKKFLSKNIGLIKEILFFFPNILEYANDEFLTDKKLVLEIVKNNVLALKYSSKVLQADRDIVLEAVKNNGYSLKYASDTIKNDREIVELSISDDAYNIKYVGESILNDRDYLIEIIKKHSGCFNHLPNEVQRIVETQMKELGIQDIIINKNNEQESNKISKGISDLLKHINNEDDLPF